MSDYVTTNVRLEKETLKQLKLRAVHEGKRMAEVIREAIHDYLFKKRVKAASITDDPIFNIIGICESGHKNDSVNHDQILYKKRKKIEK